MYAFTTPLSLTNLLPARSRPSILKAASPLYLPPATTTTATTISSSSTSYPSSSPSSSSSSSNNRTRRGDNANGNNNHGDNDSLHTNKLHPKASTRRANRSRKRSRSAARHRQGNSTLGGDNANDKWNRIQIATGLPHRPHSIRGDLRPHMSDLRPENCPALVLNADYSPLSYMPLSLWPWQDVIKAVFLDRVTVVETYDVGIRSPGMIFPLPSVISLKQYQPVNMKKPPFTRFNVFLRDEFSCQYCGLKFSTQELTFDHVLPRCMGGKTNWSNVVTACVKCNHLKGRNLLKELKGVMQLKRPAIEPTNLQLQSISKKFPPQYLHESWRDYVYWSQSMHVEAENDQDSHLPSSSYTTNDDVHESFAQHNVDVGK